MQVLSIKKSHGFTLVELIIVIALVAIAAGVSTDIISSLVRSYGKTKITNEIEQSGNFALSKIEKELKSAVTVVSVDPTQLVFEREINDILVEVTYSLINGSLFRSEDGGASLSIIQNESGGVKITNTDVFTWIQQNPDVIHIKLTFEQADATAQGAFTGSISLQSTVVLRGTYQ